MRQLYFLPKDKLIEDYQSMFDKTGIKSIELYSFDQKQDFLSNTINSIEENSVIFIPSILDSFNAYSYDGVEFALRCYFYFISNKRSNFQVVVLGSEEESSFWLHCSYSNILKCPHVKFVQNNIYSIKNYLTTTETIDWDICWDECIDGLKKLNISQPASYKTHHSITNEWCIYRWSKYLGIKNVPIQQEIEDFLYFNYLKTIYPESNITAPQSSIMMDKGKILLIDDEEEKGWDIFFKAFCKGSKFGAEFESIGKNFKKHSKEEIISQVKTKIVEYNPDVVLLDLRLHDADFEVTNPIDLTGASIFRFIKEEVNKGIQIIIFSASNKVWNYLPFSYDGIVLKESPENSMSGSYTIDCFRNLYDTLKTCLSRKFLKEIYKKMRDVKMLIESSGCFGDKTEEVTGSIETAFELLSKAEKENTNSEYYAYTYLQLFLVIEQYVNQDSVMEITEEGLNLLNGQDRYRVLKNKKQIEKKNYEYDSKISFNSHFTFQEEKYYCRFIETNYRVSALLIYKFGKNTSAVMNWTDIYKVRNDKAAHPKKEVVKIYEIHQIIDFMLYFFDDKNFNWRPLSDAFPERSDEENKSLLREKFGNVIEINTHKQK